MKYDKIVLAAIFFLSAAFAFPAMASTPAASANASSGIYFFEHNLSAGTISSDVEDLQKYLNAHGFILAKTGPGSPGNETTKFGSATRAALIRFQLARKISPASGYFGPLTRAAVNAAEQTATAPVAPASYPTASASSIVSEVNNSSAVATTASSTPAPVKINNWQVIAANTCTSLTYTDWTPCSPWHDQTRGILTSAPAGCSGGNYVLEQACGLASSTVSSNAANLSAGSSSPTFDDLLLAAAFLDNGKNVGMSCKPWVNKVLSLVTNGSLALPFQLNDYSWALNPGGRVINRNTWIEGAGRADILQFLASDDNLQHTAIVVTATPTGMVWIHSNWDKTDTVSVDFITYAYFKSVVGSNYTVYHIN
jgi:peptidoglycan hydrolase-like protein with peptidoglycan-binding domain